MYTTMHILQTCQLYNSLVNHIPELLLILILAATAAEAASLSSLDALEPRLYFFTRDVVVLLVVVGGIQPE